jgi:hypothetical protein
MRSLILCAFVAGGLIFVTGALTGFGAEPTLEDYAKAGQPGPEHKKLEPLVGSWTYTMKMWMDPAKPPMEGNGTAERKWILGGRFVQEENVSESFGEKFTGIGITGYDNTQGKFTSGWIDSMSTSLMASTGTIDKEGKVLTFTSESLDPVTKKPVKSKDVIKMESKDKQVSEMYKILDGKEVKVMELIYTRKK